jgi:prepilin-type N-terminal cleavage/methylation domain-containing protein
MNMPVYPSCLHRGDSRGFTLLEVLVALSVLAIALVVVMQVFSANLRNLSVSEQQVYAVSRAETIMRDIQDDESFPDVPSGGTTDDGYRYSVSVVKVLEERSRPVPADLLSVSVTVAWTEGRRERSLLLQSYRLIERKP